MSDRILVVGASSGIGAHLSRVLSNSGATVFCLARRPLEEWEDVGLSKKIRLDISNSEELDAVFEKVFTKENFPQTVINCAGMGTGLLFMASKSNRWEETLDANFLHPLNVQNEFAKRASGYKVSLVSIIFSSLSTDVVVSGNSIYGAAKAALERAHQGMAFEYQKFGHLFYTLSPSLVTNTPMADSLGEKVTSDYQHHLIFSTINLEEVGNLVEYLVKKRPKSLSGTKIQLGGKR
jgi:NAD(P)-dependent dehydrogenase (short-subunit alcohol dehydrogenase family)